MNRRTFIRVRTQFEGFHYYPGAGDINPDIKFLEYPHRHMFKVEAKIQVFDDNRELEFFLVKWDLEKFLSEKNQNHKSCEMIANDIAQYILDKYGKRNVEVTVSEDGESDGIVEIYP